MTRLSLDINLLAVLDVLLQEQHVGRAARRLNLSQPAVSGALARLRAHFNDDLFIRRRKSMDPTPFLLSISPALKDFLVQARAVSNARPSFDPNASGRTFIIIASDYIASVFLSRLLTTWPAVGSGTSITIEPLSTESETRFAAGHGDFLISPKRYAHPHAVYTSDRLVALVDNRAHRGRRLTRGAYNEAGQIVPLLGRDIARRVAPLGAPAGIVAQVPFGLIPDMLLGTPHIAVVPEQFARLQTQRLPLKVLELPIDAGALVEHVYWRRADQADLANMWLREKLLRVAHAVEPGVGGLRHGQRGR